MSREIRRSRDQRFQKEVEKKNLVRGSVDDYAPEDWEQVAKKVRFNEKGEAFVPSSSSTAGSEKRPATEVPTGERNSKFSHIEPARGSMRASMSTTVSQAKKLKMDNLGSVTVDLNDCVPTGRYDFSGFLRIVSKDECCNMSI